MSVRPPGNQPQDTLDKGCERVADKIRLATGRIENVLVIDGVGNVHDPHKEAVKQALLGSGLRALVEFVWHVSLTPDGHPRLLVSEKQRALAVIKKWETGHE